MAKFLKSIFQPSETHRSVSYDSSEASSEEQRNAETPSMEVRRKLSISRSGRMKQAQKKRLSLSLDIYGGDVDIQSPEKPKSVQYHVSQLNPSRENPLASPNQSRDSSIAAANQRRRSRESMSSTESGKVILRGQGNQVTVVPKVSRLSAEIKTPDEEIDSAFEIIDKS